MITKTKSYQTEDGTVHATLQEAQLHEVSVLIDKMFVADGPTLAKTDVAKFLVAEREKLVDILTTTEKSRPKTRAVNGGKRTRKPKSKPTDTAAVSTE